MLTKRFAHLTPLDPTIPGGDICGHIGELKLKALAKEGEVKQKKWGINSKLFLSRGGSIYAEGVTESNKGVMGKSKQVSVGVGLTKINTKGSTDGALDAKLQAMQMHVKAS